MVRFSIRRRRKARLVRSGSRTARALSSALVFVLGTFLMHSSPASAQESYASQQPVARMAPRLAALENNRDNLNRMISVRLEDVRLIDAIEEIADRADLWLAFGFYSDLFEERRSIEMTDVTVLEALNEVTRGTQLQLKLSASGYLLVSRKPTIVQAEDPPTPVQTGSISGRITDAETGDVLPGVNVVIVGTEMGAATDLDGEYQITGIDAGTYDLRATFIGFQEQIVTDVEVADDRETNVDIVLQPEAVDLDEVVVVAYGTMRKQEVTGAVSEVSGEELVRVPASNVGEALSGRLPGLATVQSHGQPGADEPEIFLRGVASLSEGRSQPLFVLDGVAMRDASSIMQLDANNIESISVLKDASATAVYGIEGANGVIEVTTKRGRAGRLEVSVTSSGGFRTPTTWPEMTDAYTLASAYDEAEATDGVPLDQRRFTREALAAFRTGSNPILYPDIDWQEYLFRDRALQTQTNVTVSGGTEDLAYHVSLGYFKQDGFFKTFDQGYDYNPSYDRYNLRSNLDLNLTSTTRLAVTAAGRVGQRQSVRQWSNGGEWFLISNSAPYSAAGFVDGRLVGRSDRYIPGDLHNGLLDFWGKGYDQDNVNALNLNVAATQDLDAFVNGLQFQLKGAYNSYYTRVVERASATNVIYEPLYRMDVDPDAPGDSTIVYRKEGTDDILHFDESYAKDRDWYTEARLTLDRDFGRHGVTALLLYGQRKRYYPSEYTGIPRGLINTVGRLNYNYGDRYLMELSAGYNGSENFAPEYRWGLFPAVSAGWILTNEPYMPDLPLIDFLKLRGSFGIVGNDTGIGRFLYLADQYNANTGGYNFGHEVPQNRPGASEARLGNPQVAWETAHKQDYGVDLRMFDNRLDLSAGYFYQFRDGILITRNTVPSFVAADLPAVNIGEVESRGFEAEVAWRQQIGDLYYSISGNVTYARSKILEMDEVPPSAPYQSRIGHPVGQVFGYEFDGFYTEEDIDRIGTDLPVPEWQVMPGFMKYRDINGDGVLNTLDRVPIGHPEDRPGYSVGSTWTFSFRNVDLSATWAGAFQVSELLAGYPHRLPFGDQLNGSMMQWQYDERWTPERGQDAAFPRLSIAATERELTSDFWLRDASYLRLKSLEVGYTFSGGILNSFGANDLRVFLNGYNLLTFSKLMDDTSLDPESETFSFNTNLYPVMKVYNMGVKLWF